MNEFVMHRVEAVFDRPLVIGADVDDHDFALTPSVLTVLLDLIERRPFFFRHIAEKCEHDAVFLLHRIAVDFGAGGGLVAVQGWNCRATSVARVAPAMIRTCDTAIDDFPFAQCSPPVDTDVAQDTSGAILIAKCDETETQKV